MKEINWGRATKIIWMWQGITAVAASVMVAIMTTLMANSLPPQIPLFYSHPWGEEQLVAPWEMVWPLGLVWIAWGLSWLVQKLKRERILTAFVAGAGLAAEIIIVLGLVRIVMIVT